MIDNNAQNIKENNKLEEKDSQLEEEVMGKKRKKKQSKQKDIWAKIPDDVIIKMPKSSPTFNTGDLDKVYEEVFKKKKSKKK